MRTTKISFKLSSKSTFQTSQTSTQDTRRYSSRRMRQKSRSRANTSATSDAVMRSTVGLVVIGGAPPANCVCSASPLLPTARRVGKRRVVVGAANKAVSSCVLARTLLPPALLLPTPPPTLPPSVSLAFSSKPYQYHMSIICSATHWSIVRYMRRCGSGV